MSVPEIDLHGLRRRRAESVLRSWIPRQRVPFRIITGNGGTLAKLAKEILDAKGYKYQNASDWNLGCLVIYERKR